MSKTLNIDGRFSVCGWDGIAFYIHDYASNEVPVIGYTLDDLGNQVECETGEFETETDYSKVVVVMVGDDRKHTVDVDDLTELVDGSYCHTCGQIGCYHNA